MKKLIVMAAAAGALAVAGAASAQDLGTVIGSLFGFGGTQYPSYSTSQPAVVAGTVPYGSTVTVDQYGRQVYIDQYGRQVYVQPNTTSNYGIVGYDQWGRPIYGQTNTYGSYGSYGTYGSNGQYPNYAYSNRNDRDGDGVPNWADRYPDDPRYR